MIRCHGRIIQRPQLRLNIKSAPTFILINVLDLRHNPTYGARSMSSHCVLWHCDVFQKGLFQSIHAYFSHMPP